MATARRRRTVESTGMSGFTLIELMIVVAIIAIIAAIATPNLVSARLAANQSSAVASLRTVTSAQSQFKTAGKADEDEDGTGEYGYLAELGGRVGVRGAPLQPPFQLGRPMGLVSATGEIQRSGYTMRMYIPEPGGVGHREEPGGGVTPGVLDTEQAELTWCVYAWPSAYGGTGTRTFFVNESGGITAADNAANSGTNCTSIQAGSALITNDPTRQTGKPAIGTYGADGSFWKQVQ